MSDTKPIDWDIWFSDHRRTCEQCREAHNECDRPICPKAFRVLQRCVKQTKPTGDAT